MNNDFLGHSRGDLLMIFTRGFVTRENHWQIASLVIQKSLFTVTHALFFISLFIHWMYETCSAEVIWYATNRIEVLQIMDRLTARDRREFVLPGYCLVFLSGPFVFGETITAIALWRHNSSRWDNTASVAAHNNTASRTIAFTFKCQQHYHIRKTKWYRYHVRTTKWYGYADHVGCIRVKFAPCTG